MSELTDLGRRIDILMKEQKIKSNQVLANLVGKSEGLIRNLKTGKADNYLYIEKIANEYGYNPKWLLEGEGEKRNPNFVSKDSGLIIKKGEEIVTLDEIASLAGNNEEEFFAHKYFQNKIDLEVTKKFLQLKEDPEAYLKFIGLDKKE